MQLEIPEWIDVESWSNEFGPHNTENGMLALWVETRHALSLRASRPHPQSNFCLT